MTKKYSRWVLVALLALSACSGQSALTQLDGSVQKVKLAEPMTPGPALTEDQLDVAHLAVRQAIINARVDRSLPRQERALKYAAAVRGLPHVFDAGATSLGDVWIRLTDGTPIAISTEPRQAPAPTDPNPLDSPMTYNRGAYLRESMYAAAGALNDWLFPSVIAQSAAGYTIPQSNTAVLIENDGLAPNSSRTIATMLQSKQYRVVVRHNPKVAVLRTEVRNVGVFWFSSHGVYHADTQGFEQFALLSADKYDTPKCADPVDVCAANRLDRDEGRIFISFNEETQSGGIALRGGFVAKYWKFSPSSLVVFDACSSSNTSWANQEMWKVLGTAGAAAYVGWSKPVLASFAEKAMTYFFDRVLGADTYMRLTPAQRPFSTSEVMASMKAKGRDVDSGGARMTLTPLSQDDVILRPSIRNMNVDEDKQTLELYGEFGKTEGTIEINGVPLAAQWANDRIVAQLPATGASSKGLVAAHVNQFFSNEAPVTEWVGQFWGRNYFDGLLGPPGPYFEINCSKLRVRADIHVYREKPEQDARAGWMDDTHGYSPEVPFLNVNSDTTCAHSSGGHGIQDLGPTEHYRNEFSGGASPIRWATHTTSGGLDWLIAVGKVKPKERQITLNLDTRSPLIVRKTSTQIPACPTSGCKVAVTTDFGPPSIGHVGYEMSKRLYGLDAGYNLPVTNDSFSITFQAPDLSGLPPGFQLPPGIDWSMFGQAPHEQGEVRWNLNADPVTIPTPQTPG